MQEFFKSYFNKLDLTTVFENLLTKVISLLILFVLFYIAKQLLHAAVKRIVKPSLKYSKRDAVSSLLAGAGIAGVAIGMGAQGFLSDVINGFFILFERQLDVGDEVVLTNGPITVSGKVVSVGIRTTQLRGEDQALHFVPNRNITVVSNFSREELN